MKIAIVGTSFNVTENEERDLRQMIAISLKLHDPDNDFVISGGSKGVDTMAIEIAQGLGFAVEVFRPEKEQWEGGYKVRNLEIAHACDYIYSFSVPHYNDKRRTPCYHHGDNQLGLPHLKTAGCWTLMEAMKLGKRSIVLVTPKRF